MKILATVSNRGYPGYAYARAGRRRDAGNIVADLIDPFNQALVFAGLGDKDRTQDALDRMSVLGSFRIGRRSHF